VQPSQLLSVLAIAHPERPSHQQCLGMSPPPPGPRATPAHLPVAVRVPPVSNGHHCLYNELDLPVNQSLLLHPFHTLYLFLSGLLFLLAW
jgi:hypothetical protein